MKKLGFLAAGLCAAAFAFAVLAPGATASEPGGGTGGGGTNTVLPIPGMLDAQGDGIVAAAGYLRTRFCATDGLLLVKKGDATQQGGAFTGEADWLGLHVYFGFHDCMYIMGGRTAALLVGTGLKLHAEGFGIAFLKGPGYTLDGVAHDGSTEGVVVQIGTKLPEPHGSPTARPSTSPTTARTPEPTRTPGTTTHTEPH